MDSSIILGSPLTNISKLFIFFAEWLLCYIYYQQFKKNDVMLINLLVFFISIWALSSPVFIIAYSCFMTPVSFIASSKISKYYFVIILCVFYFLPIIIFFFLHFKLYDSRTFDLPLDESQLSLLLSSLACFISRPF